MMKRVEAIFVFEDNVVVGHPINQTKQKYNNNIYNKERR